MSKDLIIYERNIKEYHIRILEVTKPDGVYLETQRKFKDEFVVISSVLLIDVVDGLKD